MFFKKKNKEPEKIYPYQRRLQQSHTSAWDNLSFIEQIGLIVMPCGLVFIIYMICDVINPNLQWWIRVPIGITFTAIMMTLIYWWATWMSEQDW